MAVKAKKKKAGMDPVKKADLLKYSGVVVFVLTLFTFVAAVSYLFTWKADQSLMMHPDMMDKGVEVSNFCGKLGYGWARFLISDCFGLGSFALMFLMGACAFRLFYWDRSIGLLKMTMVTVSGTFIASLILSFVSMLFGPDTFFGGGLGGDAGHAVIAWLGNLVGMFATGLILAVMVIAWLIMASGRFANWFATAGERHADEVEEEPVSESHEEVIPVVECEATAEPVEPFELIEDDPALPSAASDVMTEPVTVPVDEAVPDPAQETPSGTMEVIMGGDFTEKVTEELPRIDNREELENFRFPPLDLLKDYSEGQHR